jgi:RHS repeat-associated protein
VNYTQSWDTLDSLGNWQSFTDDTNGSTTGGSTTYGRSHNAANEVTDSGGAWADPTYDAAGNMTSGPKAGDETTTQYFIYDAWNRLVGVSLNADGDVADAGEVRYEYDGLNRRIQADLAGGTADDLAYFYSEQFQVLEVRKGGDADPLEQYVWGPEYVDAAIVRYHDGNTDGDYADAMDNTLYPTYDANYNVTAVVNASGTVVERYEYLAYGEQTVLDAAYSLDADGQTDVAFYLGWQGLRQDVDTNLVYNRARFLHVTLGRYTQRDQAGYIDGLNIYINRLDNPVNRLDPGGNESWQQELKEKIKERINNIIRKLEEPGYVRDLVCKQIERQLKNLIKKLVKMSNNPPQESDPLNPGGKIKDDIVEKWEIKWGKIGDLGPGIKPVFGPTLGLGDGWDIGGGLDIDMSSKECTCGALSQP